MIVSLGNQCKIHASVGPDLFKLLQDIMPYVEVENKAIIQQRNLGFSVKNEIEKFSLMEKEHHGYAHMTLTMPIGIWDYIKHLIPDNATITDTRLKHGVILSKKDLPKLLYDYQQETVLQASRHFNGIIQAAPGSGKTIMGITLGQLVGKSVLWINDRIELARQALKTAVEVLKLPEEDCGLLQGDNENIKKYTFTTIQKLNKVLNEGFNNIEKELTPFDTIIIDECHHAIGGYNSFKTYFQVLTEIPHVRVYGLTATPDRPDGNGYLVNAIIGPIIHEVEGEVMTMPATVINKHCHIEITKETYESMLNMYTKKIMPHKRDEFLFFNEQYIEFVKPYIKGMLANYNKVLIVSPRVAGAQYWSGYLTEENIEHFLVYGAIKKRDQLYTSKVLVATLDLVKEGFDVPDLEGIIVIGNKPNATVATQIIGRAERYFKGKKSPKVYFLQPHLKRDKEEMFEELSLDEFL